MIHVNCNLAMHDLPVWPDRKQKVIRENDALLSSNLHRSSAFGGVCVCVCLDLPSSCHHKAARLKPPTAQAWGPEAGSFLLWSCCAPLCQLDFTDQDKLTSHQNLQEMMQRAASVRNGRGMPNQRWTVCLSEFGCLERVSHYVGHLLSLIFCILCQGQSVDMWDQLEWGFSFHESKDKETNGLLWETK